MISKFCAAWLIVLVLSPFTAPFSTCDFSRPLRAPGRGIPFKGQSAAAAIDTNAALVPARVISTGPRIDVCLEDVDRNGLPLSHLAACADSILSVVTHESLHTILRL